MSKTFSRSVVSTVALLAALGLGTGAYAGNTDVTKTDEVKTESYQDATKSPGDVTTDTVTQKPVTMDKPDQKDPAVTMQKEADARTDGKVEGQIVFQDADTFLVSSLIGSNVETPQGDVIGDINDVLAGKDGTIDGIVIGVGGFLGIGEKNVAIEFDRIDLVETDGKIRLVIDTTEKELQDAPEFKTVDARTEAPARDDMEKTQTPPDATTDEKPENTGTVKTTD